MLCLMVFLGADVTDAEKIQELEAEIARLRQALIDVSEWWIDGRDPAALALGALSGGKKC